MPRRRRSGGRGKLGGKRGRSTRDILTRHSNHSRLLRFEPLECRRLLAITVNTILDVVDPTDGKTSLREAIAAAPSGEVINFAPSVSGTMDLNPLSGEMQITTNITINGPGPNLLTISAEKCDPTSKSTLNDNKNDDGDGERIFNISASNVAIHGLKFIEGDAGGVGDDGKGGAIRSTGTNLTIGNCVIEKNHAFIPGDSVGGGVFCAGTLTITNSTISGNEAPRGGGIYARTVMLSAGSIVSNNGTQVEGGGIFAKVNATVSSSRVMDNEIWPIISIPQRGGGVFAAGNITVDNESVIQGNSSRQGGGVFAVGNATVTNSVLSQNKAAFSGGGGSAYGGLFSVSNSTISENTAGDDGGGISGRNILVSFSTVTGNKALRGGGIGSIVDGGSVTVMSSTISGNMADQPNTGNLGGGIYSRDSVSIFNSTITNNAVGADAVKPTDPFRTGDGGGVASNFGPVVIRNSIVAGNRDVKDDSHPDLRLGPNANLTLEFSIIGDNSGTTLVSGNPAAGGNKIGTHVSPINALLGPLVNNGGLTSTHALLTNSPAIDMGDPGFVPPPDTDQRGPGIPRVQNGRIDMGAFESTPIPIDKILVSTLDDEFDGNFGAGDQSLREAIFLANSRGGHDDIPFADSLEVGAATISLELGQLAISDSATIEWEGTTPLRIDGDGTSRIFAIDNGSSGLIDVTLNRLLLTGGSTASSGGGILSFENLTVHQLSISGNHADEFGGGILHFSGRLDVIDSTIAGNSAGLEGGGIWNNTDLTEPRIATITNSTVSGNSAPRGGGIRNFDGLMRIKFSTITDNQADPGQGSGIASYGDSVTPTELFSSIVAGNDGSDLDFVPDLTNSFQSVGYNLIGTGNALAKFTQPGDQPNVLNPQLAALADNGGPTRTHAPLPGSAALDKGNPSFLPPPENDQRGPGFPRVDNSRIDIGSYEMQFGPTVTPEPGKPPMEDGNWGMMLNGPAAPVTFQVQRDFSIPSGGDGAVAVVANWLENPAVALAIDLDIDGTLDFKLTPANATPDGLAGPHPNVQGKLHSQLVSLASTSVTLNSAIWIVPIGTNLLGRDVRVTLIGGISTEFLAWTGTYHNVRQNDPVGSAVSQSTSATVGFNSLMIPDVDKNNSTLDTVLAMGRPGFALNNFQPDPLLQDPAVTSLQGEPQNELKLVPPAFGFPSVADAEWTPSTGFLMRAAASSDDDDPSAAMTLMEWGFQPSGAAGFTHVAVELRHAPVLPGDYSCNGIVDAADYVLWRKTLGSSVSQFLGADGNGNGMVDPGDYDVWRANFGSIAAPAAASAITSVVPNQIQATTVATNSFVPESEVEDEFVGLLPAMPSVATAEKQTRIESLNRASTTASRDDAILAWYVSLLASSKSLTRIDNAHVDTGCDSSSDAPEDVFELQVALNDLI